MTIQMIPARNCVLSKQNVRRTAADAGLQAQLQADIAARGVLQNLIGFAVPKKTGKFEITAGGRRLSSVQALIAEGVFPKDYAVPVLVLNDSSTAGETSLAENYQRQAMNPADECTAFRHFIEVDGATCEDVAKRFGLTARFVEGRIRLAGLATSVFEALRDGTISLDAAKAYGTTTDTGRQETVFAQMNNSYNRHDANVIRRMMTDETINSDHRLAKLVGRDAYVGAGGRIESDLFSGDEGEIWLDSTLVATLASEKMAAAAAALEGFGTVLTVLDGRPAWDQTQYLRPVHTPPVELTEDEKRRIIEIETEIDVIEGMAENEGLTDAEDARYEALQEEASAIENKSAEIDAETKAVATAFLVVGDDGTPKLYERVFIDPQTTRTTADDGTVIVGSSGDDDKDAGKPVIGKVLRDELAVQRTQLLALHVANDAGTAIDLTIFLLADRESKTSYGYDNGSTLAGGSPGRVPFGYKPEGAAIDALQTFHGGLDHGWAAHSDIAARFDAFRALDADQRGAWAGWTVARTLEATLVDEKNSPLQNLLGRSLGIDVAAWWRPTAANYFGRVRKSAVLETLEAIGGTELKSRYAAAKKGDIAAAAEKLCAGSSIVEAKVREAALAWVPDVMLFSAAIASDTGRDETNVEDGAEVAVTATDTDDDAAEDAAPAAAIAPKDGFEEAA